MARKAAVKTKKSSTSVTEYLAQVEPEARRADARAIDKLLREVTGEKPALWGPSIIGYGSYTLTNSMGKADWPKIAFSPRKAATVLYIDPELLATDPLMKRLGKFKTGKTCLYINKLAEVDAEVLRKLAARSFERVSKTTR